MNPPHSLDDPLLEGLQDICESILPSWREQLSELLRADVEMSLHVAQQCRLGDTLASLSDPACAMEIRGPGESWLVDIGPCLVMPLAHRLLGGGATDQIKPYRAFTEIERRLMRCVVRPLIQSLSPCGSPLADGPLELGEETTAPGWADWETDVIQLAFLVRLDEAEGYITLCLPAGTVRQKTEQICRWQTASHPDQDEECAAGIPEGDVVLSLNIPLPELDDQHFEDLEVGEILATGVPVDTPLELHLQGVPVFEATAGESEGNLAAQLTGKLNHQLPDSP